MHREITIKDINLLAKITLEDILHQQFALYDHLEIRDIYKLLYQSSLGCEHALNDKSSIFNRLQKEITELRTDQKESLFEVISPGAEIIRVNLRPFIRKGGDLKELNDKFFQSAQIYKGSLDTLVEYWKIFKRIGSAIRSDFQPQDIEKFFHKMKKINFPAISHSESYREFHSPAYRVILRKLINDELKRIS